MSKNYPKKVWTKFESEQFKERFKTGAVVPVWFSDTEPGLFDETRKVGGLTFDVSAPLDDQVSQIVRVLLDRLAESRQLTLVATEIDDPRQGGLESM